MSCKVKQIRYYMGLTLAVYTLKYLMSFDQNALKDKWKNR